ncbi:hypothetical protein K9M79_02910 [Candidatus Woesearchaeota archaeon]|nr:hypothetical protein [Candidatus Woesearchaeota archaeon]
MGKVEGKIKCATQIKEFNGKKSIGFQVEGKADWLNIYGEEEALNECMKVVKKGNVISFDVDDHNDVANVTLIEEAKQEEHHDDMNNFEDLLDKAHEEGKLMEIRTELIDHNFEQKYALVKATVITASKDDPTAPIRTFEAHGDATQENTGDMIKKHYIRMAETRAISRALRWATNNAKVATEELEN